MNVQRGHSSTGLTSAPLPHQVGRLEGWGPGIVRRPTRLLLRADCQLKDWLAAGQTTHM